MKSHPGRRVSALAGCSLALLVLCLTGCGGASTGTVSGKVTDHGQPLPGGTVNIVHQATGVTATGQIGADGSYTVGKVPTGPAKVFVVGRPGPAQPPADAPKDIPAAPLPTAPPAVHVPEKYTKAETSGLELDVKGGGQTTFDIDLK